MNHSYGLFKSLKNILPSASTIFIVGCGPVSDSHEIDWFLKHYPKSKIWAFEPMPATWNSLSIKHKSNPRVKATAAAVADLNDVTKFRINSPAGASSLLSWDDSKDKPASWITTKEIDVVTVSLDKFCKSNHIDSIDLLFMDAQGAEHLVIQGAENLRQSRKINVIIGEAIFTDLYNTPHSFIDVYNMLARTGLYEFVGFYRPVYAHNGRLHHCDYMFVRKP